MGVSPSPVIRPGLVVGRAADGREVGVVWGVATTGGVVTVGGVAVVGGAVWDVVTTGGVVTVGGVALGGAGLAAVRRGVVGELCVPRLWSW